MKLGTTLFGLVLMFPSIASAEIRDVMVDGDAQPYGFVTDAQPAAGGLMFARQVLPGNPNGPTVSFPSATPALAQSRIIFLSHNGVTLRPGNNDARTNTSSIVNAQVAIPAWNTTPQVWADTVACFRDIWSKYDVQVVDTDPGNVPHILAIFGGTPQQVGLPANVGGVSPFTTTCDVIENSVVFTFSGALPAQARLNCEIMAQEVAHSYGLDHELLASDPMTYLSYNGNRAFQNQTVSCGESTARNCGINGSVCSANQNSVAMLSSRVGLGDAIAPTLDWTSPANGAVVAPGFQVTAAASDNIAVVSASLTIDGGTPMITANGGPYTFQTPAGLADGAHTIKIDITDGKNIKSETRTITIQHGAPGGGSGGGSGSGSGSDGPGGGAPNSGDISGGCTSSGGNAGLLFGLGLFVATLRRRR
ncbi:MAG: hypothetical protein JWO36_3229 [Myxococcales bacterium]|nr:hypothetical protein [Myxococcales bacterium]